MKKKRLLQQHRTGQEQRVALAQPVAKTQLAKRMLDAFGEDDFGVLKTFQQHFGAKVVYFKDHLGEVGRDDEKVG